MRLIFLLLLCANLSFLAIGLTNLDDPITPAELRPVTALEENKIRVLGDADLAQLTAASCITLGGLRSAEAERAEADLTALKPPPRVSRQVVPDGSQWVFIPPLANRAAAERKAQELAKLKVGEYFLINTAGKWQYAIQLGVFAGESGAQARLDELRRNGVRSAEMAPYPLAEPRIQLQIRAAAVELRERLAEIAAEYSDAQLAPCPKS
jgi:hypothetical protein